MLVYVIVIVASLTVLRRDKPSVIQLSILVGINVLFILFMIRTENRLRVRARKRLKQVLKEATNTHSKLAFQMKQQDRGRKQIFYYIEVSIVMPIALSGAWEADDGDEGDVTVNLGSMVQSV
jgi:sensor domain CHASE-containing protein